MSYVEKINDLAMEIVYGCDKFNKKEFSEILEDIDKIKFRKDVYEEILRLGESDEQYIQDSLDYWLE